MSLNLMPHPDQSSPQGGHDSQLGSAAPHARFRGVESTIPCIASRRRAGVTLQRSASTGD